MPVKLKVYANEDDTLLFWSIPEPIPGCRGFAIEREKNGKLDILPNRIGFAGTPPPTNTDDGGHAALRPSTEAPFQRFSWTDHDANTGDEVSYQVTPIVRNASGTLEAAGAQASGFSPKRKLEATGNFRPFFNRGFVMSQFMTRFLKESGKSLAQFKATVSDADDQTIRRFLSGDLRLEMLRLLRSPEGDVFAVLFELNDDELINALAALGPRAHVVLANGAVEKGPNETTAEARLSKDENQHARDALKRARVEVFDRRTAPGPLAHNKFLVATDSAGKPVTAWTGSTNWTSTGLCTQLNNGLLINDPEVAQVYRNQFDLVKRSGSAFPPDLVSSNNKPKQAGTQSRGHVRSTVWFSRTKGGADLAALTEEVKNAREGILFLMFMPGATGLFSTVSARSGEANLYVKGVASELPHGRGDESAVDVNLVHGSDHQPLHLDIIQPEGARPFANFAAEVTRKQFLGGIGHAIIHSKVVVIDPFSDEPVVITGSHNFSASASAKNDENFIIVRGDRALAEAYAVNIEGAYAHYRWRALLSQAQKPFDGLSDNDTWQTPKLAANRRDLAFWGV